MINKLVVIINSLKVPKMKKILLYEMKFLVPNYSCLQTILTRGLPPPHPRSLCPLSSTEFVEPPPPPTRTNSWVRHCFAPRRNTSHLLTIRMYVRGVMNIVLGFHTLVLYRTLTKYNVVSGHCLTDSDNRMITDLPSLDQILSIPSPISLPWVTSLTNGFDSRDWSDNETG